MTKEQVWENAVKHADFEQEDRDLFFSDQITIDAESIDEIAYVDLPELLCELRNRPKLTATLSRHQADLQSSDVNDINAQDHHPSWAKWSVEECDRSFDGTHHTGCWLFC